MCDCHIGITEDFFKKVCEKGGAWVDSEGACVDKKRNEKECRDCKFWREEEKLKI